MAYKNMQMDHFILVEKKIKNNFMKSKLRKNLLINKLIKNLGQWNDN